MCNVYRNLKPELINILAPFLGEKKLNLGCALNHEEGFTNLDGNREVNPDVVHDLESVPLPFEDGSFDTVLGSHVFEHIRNFVPLVGDIYRVLKPGGYLIGITPYASSDNAMDNPWHVRCFTEATWQYFSQDMYRLETAGKGANEGYKGNFEIVRILLIPDKRFEGDPEIEFKKRHWRNVVRELQVVLRKT